MDDFEDNLELAAINYVKAHTSTYKYATDWGGMHLLDYAKELTDAFVAGAFAALHLDSELEEIK